MSKKKSTGKADDVAVPSVRPTPEEVSLIETHRALTPAGRDYVRRALLAAIGPDEATQLPIQISLRHVDATQCLADLGRLCALIEVARLAVHTLDEGDLEDDGVSDGLSSIFDTLTEARAIYWRSLADVSTDLFHSIRLSQEDA